MTASFQFAGLLLAFAVAAQQAPPTSTRTPQKPPSQAPAPKAQGTPSAPSSGKSGQAGAPSSADTATTPARKSTLTLNWKKYCAPEGDFCVKYPPTWQPLGDTADSGGLVIAPAQPAKQPAQWSHVTVTATDLPEQQPGKERPEFDELIGSVLDSMRQGVRTQTLERREMTIEGMAAQWLKLKYEDENRQSWIEEIVLIDGEDVIYSVVLRCTPDELSGFEPIFREIVGTWRFVEPSE